MGPKWKTGRSRNQTPAFILYLPSILYPLYCILFTPHVVSQCSLSIPLRHPAMILSYRRFYPPWPRGQVIRCSVAWPTRREAVISLTSLIRCRNVTVLTPGSKSPFVRAPRPIHSFPFRPSFGGTRLDGLGGGGFGGRGDGGRSRDWHTAEARCEVHDAIVVRVLRKVKAFVREEEQVARSDSRGTSTGVRRGARPDKKGPARTKHPTQRGTASKL